MLSQHVKFQSLQNQPNKLGPFEKPSGSHQSLCIFAIKLTSWIFILPVISPGFPHISPLVFAAQLLHAVRNGLRSTPGEIQIGHGAGGQHRKGALHIAWHNGRHNGY